MNLVKTILVFQILYLFQVRSFAQENNHILLHTDFIEFKDKIAKQDFFIQSDSALTVSLSVRCYKLNPISNDSVLIAKSVLHNLPLKKGLNKLVVDYSSRRNDTYIEPLFHRILKDLDIIPPGNYVVYSELSIGTEIFSKKTIREYDSVLSMNSSLRKDMNEVIEKNTFLSSRNDQHNNIENANTHFENNASKVLSKRGLHKVTTRVNNKVINDFFYDTYFVGRYTIELGSNLLAQVAAEKSKIANSTTSFVNNGLENYESVFSQLKKIKENSKDEQAMQGEFGLTANMSNQAEAFSSQDKNFYEFNGSIDVPIFGMPVQIEGYYTTQDVHRRAKASYIRFHYDVDKAKSKLMELIGGYNSQYEQTMSKGKGLDAVYKSYLKNLSSQKSRMLLDMARETGVNELAGVGTNTLGINKNNLDTTALLQTMLSKVDTNGSLGENKEKVMRKKDSLFEVYTKAMKKYKEIKEIQQKIEKYYTLIEQYKNTSYFDSLMTYDKVKDLKNHEDMSYKDMAKLGSGLLPDGKVKQVATGLTNLDIGMFPKYTSKYTMGGQMLKGIDVGYDIGFATTTATVGKTEYIGRDGTVDKYTCYSGSAKLKPILKQEFEFIYYGYSPSKKMFSSDKEFFKNMDTQYPTFKNPTHIVSVNYTGQIGKGIQTTGEVATSMKKGTPNNMQTILSNDKLAYALGIEGDIPKTNITSSLEYEHTGKDFENNTIPFSLSGTERIRTNAKSSFFKSFLHLGIEYNYLIQHNTTNDSKSTRWGFDIKTQSKRYPTIALSYKPFSTFRSFTDTLGIPQRPLLGEVWTGKASYQFKKDKKIYRLMFLYNKNTSKLDTANYNNDLLQFSFFYTNKKFMGNVTLANMKMNSNVKENIPAWHSNKAYITSCNGTYLVDKQLIVQAGFDVGLSKYGISNTGVNGGLNYRMIKFPLSYRISTRYNRYKVEEIQQWQNRIGGLLALVWNFKYIDKK